MSIYEILILSFIEILSISNVWQKMNRKVNNQRSKNITIVFIILLLVSILNHYKVDNGFIVIYGTMALLYLALFKIPRKYILFELISVIGILVTIQLLVTCLVIIIKGELEYSFISGLAINVILFISSLIIKKYVPLDKLLVLYKQNYKNLNILILFIGIPSIMFIDLWKNNEEVYLSNLKTTLLYITIWLIVGIYFVYTNIKFIQKKRELKIQSAYTSILKELVGDLRKVQHDHKNHLATILSMMENEDKDFNRIEKYIENIIGKAKDIDKSLNIKNPVINAIIYNKMVKAKANDIKFLIKFKEIVPNYEMEDYELVEILGNLLDNAIEANLYYEVNDKKIIITLGVENNKKIIEVKNTADLIGLPAIENIFRKGYSTKKEKLRGFGLNNVKDIVKTYKGTLEFSIEDDLVTIKVLL